MMISTTSYLMIFSCLITYSLVAISANALVISYLPPMPQPSKARVGVGVGVGVVKSRRSMLLLPRTTTSWLRPATLLSSSSLSASDGSTEIVIISPPGGIGEMTSVEAARLGGQVKWFVISPPLPKDTSSSSTKQGGVSTSVALTAETLLAIEKAGGSLQLAGASADSLLLQQQQGEEGSRSALAAMAAWCANSNCIISTYDNGGGVSSTIMVNPIDRNPISMDNNNNNNSMVRAAIRLATKEAALGMTMMPSSGESRNKIRSIVILPTGLEEENAAKTDDIGAGAGGGSLFGLDLFGGKGKNEPFVPTTLMEAAGNTKRGGDGSCIVIRYGELFGAPESSPESSPFMGGPKRDPVVRDMYTMRSVRVDPTISTISSTSSSSGSMMFKSNRLAVAEMASQMGMGKIENIISSMSLDVSLSSFAGTEKPTEKEWNAEFERIMSETLSSSSRIDGKIQQRPLFRAEFASVPSTKRLAEWIATKWAPAVLRSYDIAGIRVGARPVYALLQSPNIMENGSHGNESDSNLVEIIWQELVDFNSVTSGRMIIEIGETGIVARRGAGDAAKGFGLISSLPLPGEDILVRRLADAASQAIEKGLAVKPTSDKKSSEVAISKKPVTTVVADSVVSNAVPTPIQNTKVSSFSNDSSGPRSAGARRSSERSRGNRNSSTALSPTTPPMVDKEE